MFGAFKAKFLGAVIEHDDIGLALLGERALGLLVEGARRTL